VLPDASQTKRRIQTQPLTLRLASFRFASCLPHGGGARIDHHGDARKAQNFVGRPYSTDTKRVWTLVHVGVGKATVPELLQSSAYFIRGSSPKLRFRRTSWNVFRSENHGGSPDLSLTGELVTFVHDHRPHGP
jgi:hypothetical protein